MVGSDTASVEIATYTRQSRDAVLTEARTNFITVNSHSEHLIYNADELLEMRDQQLFRPKSACLSNPEVIS